MVYFDSTRPAQYIWNSMRQFLFKTKTLTGFQHTAETTPDPPWVPFGPIVQAMVEHVYHFIYAYSLNKRTPRHVT